LQLDVRINDEIEVGFHKKPPEQTRRNVAPDLGMQSVDYSIVEPPFYKGQKEGEANKD
jgi:hypothetical protein